MKYVAIIGLEVHAELKTETKLFCRCRNTSSELQTLPNTAVCPVCVGLPGALPVLNKKAVESTVKLGLSLGCNVPEVTKWDRKNYFYPDLPKGYQISQYDEPLCAGGVLAWTDRSGAKHDVALTRIHLEEDTGKLTHPAGTDYSLIDYNRSSIPLLELVTEPVIGSAEEAKQFCEEYQRHLRDLGVAEASMEKGQMRCEANISVVPEEYADDPNRRLSGTKVEVKNLNSFRSLERAIEYEIKRQSEALERGETLTQETRGWNEAKGETYAMRTKETSDDYRYFPEPDLPPLKVPAEFRVQATGSRNTLLEELTAHDVPAESAFVVVNDAARREAFDRLKDAGLPDTLYRAAIQWLAQEPKLATAPAQDVVVVLQKIERGEVSPAIFKQAISQFSDSLASMVEELLSAHNDLDLESVIQDVIATNPTEVARYKAGEAQLFGFFVGQVKKRLQGAGDPAEIARLLKEKL